MEKITACLITKEKQYPQRVLERLTLGFFDEILIKTKSPSVYQRYLLAAEARNDTIFVIDDDALVNYQQLWKHYDGRITNAMPKNRIEEYEKKGCTLVGWGCYFPSHMLGVFDKYIAKYGEDAHLLREADRIMTTMNRPFNTIIMPHEDLPRANSEQAMWRDPHHFTSAEEAIAKCRLL